MLFKELINACDEVGNHDLIQLYTYCFIDSTGHVSVDNYHNLTEDSHVDIVYNAASAPFSFSTALQESFAVKSFEWFKRLLNTAYIQYDSTCLPNYAIIKYKDYNIGRLYGITTYEEVYKLIQRAVFWIIKSS